ncbi:MAG: pyridoxal-phosphate dependent enzyme [Haloferacaceae archaeon]
METTDAFRGLDCTATGERYDPDHVGRSDADAPLDPAYDYDAVDPADLTADADSMWTYDALLPVPADRGVSAVEGATPLVPADGFAADLGVDGVFVKDEGRNPTGTVLDRGLSLAVTMGREHGADLFALASPGNAGQSAAAYVERVGADVYAFLPSRAPFPNKAMVNVHGGDMRVVGGRFADALSALHEDLQTDWYSLQEFTTPYRHDGIKTLAFEVVAELGDRPDAVVVPTSTGEVLAGVAKGFRELRAVGATDGLPRLYAAQAAGCAPVVAAHERGVDDPEPWEHPDTIAGELEIADPAGGRFAVQAVDESGGDAVAVDDEDVLESAVVVTQRLGTEVGATAGAAAAGAWELADEAFDADDTVVIVNADAGVKTADVLRSHLMGKGI